MRATALPIGVFCIPEANTPAPLNDAPVPLTLPFDVNTFTVAVASATTNGNVTMYPEILAEFDCSNGTAFYTLIPGEGILAEQGIFVGIPNVAITTTLFYD